jgi:hypothetical protein
MIESLSSTVKAGRLIRLLGWVNLIFTIIIGTAIVLPYVAKNEPIQFSLWALLAGVVFVSLAILVVGAGVKKNKAWAKVLGAIVSVLSLANIPIGTIVGAIAIFYLAKDWSDNDRI